MRRYGAWVAILLLTIYLVFYGGSWPGIYSTWLRQVSVVAALTVIAVWSVVAWRQPAWRPRSVLMPAIAAILVSLAVSTAVSRDPRQSIEYLGYAVLLAALYLLLVRIMAEPFLRQRMGVLAVALTAAIGGVYAVANIATWVDWWGVVGRITVPPLRPNSLSLTFGNPSAVLTIVLLFWCSTAAVVGLHSPTRRAVVGALGLVTAFTILVSGSRGGWFGIALAIVIVGAVWLSGQDRRSQARSWVIATVAGRGRRGARVLAGAAVAFAFAALILVGPTILRRLGSGGEDLRLNYLLAASRMFAEAPILGTGPGTWVIQRVRYTYAPETDYYIPHAHNIYAQTLAELGVVGALAGVILFVSLARLLRDAIRDEDPVRRRWGWAATFALVYFAAHQVIDFYPNMPAVLFAAALPVAWLDATARPGPVRVPGRTSRLGNAASLAASRAGSLAASRAGLLAGLLAVVVAAGGLMASEQVAAVHSNAVAAYNEGDWRTADVLAQEAVERDPSWAPYQLTVGLTAAAVGDHQRAADAFRRTALTDDLPEAWLDLAAEETLLGNRAAALDALRGATRLGLQRAAIAMATGDLALRLEDRSLAAEAFAAAVVLLPSLAGDPWWQADPARAQLLPEVVDRAIETTSPLNGWEIALMAGDPERARTLLQAAPPAAGAATPADVIDAWEGDAAALDRILAATQANPLDAFTLAWAARLESRRGDVEASNRYRRWAFTGVGAGLESGVEIRVSDRPLLGRTIAGRVADFWGTYTYRRPTPWNPLVPSLVQLTVE